MHNNICSTRENIAAAQAIVARVRALAARASNNMMFAAQAAQNIDTEQAVSTGDTFDERFALDAAAANDGTQEQPQAREAAETQQSDDAPGMGRSPFGARQFRRMHERR